MENKGLFKNPIERSENISTGAIAKSFLANVFTYMSAALGITGLIAFIFGTDMELMSILFKVENGILTNPNFLGYFVMFAPLGLVLLMSSRFQKFSSSALVILFIVFSVLMGISMSTIFLRYTGESIFSTFFITAGTFGVMALLGYTTKTDLTKFGSILMMGVIGIIIAMVVNMFIGSTTMDLIISALGVLIFTGLTAYDVQKLKRIGSGVEYGTDETNKLAIMGALNLYLDFINLFLFLLRFMGNRR
jgi:FtsH-binding integral membrane protein